MISFSYLNTINNITAIYKELFNETRCRYKDGWRKKELFSPMNSVHLGGGDAAVRLVHQIG